MIKIDEGILSSHHMEVDIKHNMTSGWLFPKLKSALAKTKIYCWRKNTKNKFYEINSNLSLV